MEDAILVYGTMCVACDNKDIPNRQEAFLALDRLKQDQAKLRALEAAGVENWEGYDKAMEAL